MFMKNCKENSVCETVSNLLSYCTYDVREYDFQLKGCQCWINFVNLDKIKSRIKRTQDLSGREKENLLNFLECKELKIVTSYATDVAIDVDQHIYSLGRYTATTTQQMNKYVHYMYPTHHVVYSTLLFEDWYEKPSSQPVLKEAYENGNCNIYALPAKNGNGYKYFDLRKPAYFPKRKAEAAQVEAAAKQI